MDEIPKLKTGETRHRWLTAIKDKALDSIRNMVVLETQAEHFLKVLESGSRFHEHLFAAHSQLRPGHELAAVAGAAQETLACLQFRREARHHLGGTSGHRRPRRQSRTQGVLQIGQLVQQQHLDTNGVTVLSSEGFAHEPGGQVKSYTNALGGVTTIAYTTNGLPKFRSNPDGSTNAWRYYLDGRIKQEIQVQRRLLADDL